MISEFSVPKITEITRQECILRRLESRDLPRLEYIELINELNNLGILKKLKDNIK